MILESYVTNPQGASNAERLWSKAEADAVIKRGLKVAVPHQSATIFRDKDNLSYVAVTGSNVVGYLHLVKAKVPEIGLIYVSTEFIGQGIGSALYHAAIKTVGKIRSDSSLSRGATGAWKRLSEHFDVCLVIPADSDYGISNWTRVDIVGWEAHDGYQYPKVMFKGRPTSFRMLLKSGSAESLQAAEMTVFQAENVKGST